MSSELAKDIVSRDVDASFLESAVVGLGWAYSGLYEQIVRDPLIPENLREEQFSRRRGLVVSQALAQAAKKHGVPYEFRRLECNGQSKLLVKAGRVVLFQEPILTLSDKPKISDYKLEIAKTHGFVSQLELDLGDIPNRIYDWSGSVVVVLLHGARGQKFTREHKAIGSVMLGVPDAEYTHWISRIELSDVALFGWPRFSEASDNEGIAQQEDRVRVSPKRSRSRIMSFR